ncbi:hypothetical protein JW823_04680 [bacterium]|nr:hypothetical protein [candidate division CSSED10-310 bacterium]
MKTAPGLDSNEWSQRNVSGWTDSTSAGVIIAVLVIIYVTFFNPILRYDGIQYMAPARSLLIDGNLNTYDEGVYYTQPGWSDVSKRKITGRPPPIISYVSAPDYTSRGYRFVVFPIGNPIIWLPPLGLCHLVISGIPALQTLFPADGFSLPYRLGLGWWSFLIGATGLVIAYKILRIWYRPVVACVSSLFVFTSGNIIQFVTRDVTFSHCIDFLLINASIMMFLKLANDSEQNRQPIESHLFWGILSGYTFIVRYQDVVLIILPLWYYIFEPDRHKGNRWRNPILFLTGLLFSTGLQLFYWKILYGSWLISNRLMGTGCLASFQPLKPQLLDMLFSRFHGLFNWMPWMLVLTIAYLLFIKRNKRFGILFLIIMVIQTYYISSRSEWWNLGFSVRRYAGWNLFFMIGAAEIFSRCGRPVEKIACTTVVVLTSFWSWLFQICYHSMSRCGHIYKHLIRDSSPYHPVTYHPILPSRIDVIRAIVHLKTWFAEYTLFPGIVEFFKTNYSLVAIALLSCHILFLIVLSIWIQYLKKTTLPLRNLLAVSLLFILIVSVWMIQSDIHSKDVIVHRLSQNRRNDIHQVVRIPVASEFMGENVFLDLSDEPITFTRPDPVNAQWGFALLGSTMGNDKATVAVRLKRDGVVFDEKRFGMKAGITPDVVRIEVPWKEVSDDRYWYVMRSEPTDESAVPDSWDIVLIEGESVQLGAFWHYLD